MAGVSHSTVSLALRDSRSISKETREQVKAVAQQLGYRPDPMLSALMVYRRGVRQVPYQATLAWVTFGREPVAGNSFNHAIFQGAKERCDELGYSLEEFMLADVGMNMKRLSKVLYSRNIQGVIMGPQNRKISHINAQSFAWDQFSVITFGFSLVSPQLDMVIDAQYRSGRIAVRKLRSLGYRHIGFVIDSGMNNRTDGNFLAGYVSEQMRFPSSNLIPPLICYSKNSEQECREWLRRYQPDAVFDPVCHLLQILGRENPQPFAIAVHGLSPDGDRKIAGIVHNVHLIGRVGVDEVVSMIQTNRRGIPDNPRRILIEGSWQDGESAPRVAPKARE